MPSATWQNSTVHLYVSKLKCHKANCTQPRLWKYIGENVQTPDLVWDLPWDDSCLGGGTSLASLGLELLANLQFCLFICWALVLSRLQRKYPHNCLLPACFPPWKQLSLSLLAPNGNDSAKLFEIPFAEGFLLCRKLGVNFLCLPQLQGPVEDQLQIPFFLSSRTEKYRQIHFFILTMELPGIAFNPLLLSVFPLSIWNLFLAIRLYISVGFFLVLTYPIYHSDLSHSCLTFSLPNWLKSDSWVHPSKYMVLGLSYAFNTCLLLDE